MAPRERLNVTIIGAGVAGLVAARVLREHHKVTVLESNSGNREIGAALRLGQTAKDIVERLGFDLERGGARVYTGGRTYDMNNRLIATHDSKEYADLLKAEMVLCHRVDLWEELYRLATTDSKDLGIVGEPAQVQFGSAVADVNVTEGIVTLSDGQTIQSDLVIAADGITSLCRSLVTQQDDFRTARPAGTSAFRFLLSADQLNSIHPNIDVLDRQRPVTVDVHIGTDGSKRSVVMYPVRNYQLVNFVCIVPDSMVPRETKASWLAEGTRQDLARCFEDWGPFLRDILAHAPDNVKLWQLRDHDPLPTYIRGRTILIGDSAHAMTPHAAMGATTAIEDGEAFDLFNDADVDRSAVPDILKQIDRVRRPRASRIQLDSRRLQSRRSADEMYRDFVYHMTYRGIRECLRRLDDGEEMIPVPCRDAT